MLKKAISRGWSPIIITAVAIFGLLYRWPVILMIVLLGVILVIGLVVTAVSAKEEQLERASVKLRQLAGYFNRRFMGTSSLSIFAIIDNLFNLDDPQLWDWARACDMSQRVFDNWCNGFTSRLEIDMKTGRFRVYLHIYLQEFWLINNHYYDFVEQFYEIATKIELPPPVVEQYNRFAVEYDTFVQNFRNSIAELKRIAKTEIEPPSVKMVRELSGGQTLSSAREDGTYS